MRQACLHPPPLSRPLFKHAHRPPIAPLPSLLPALRFCGISLPLAYFLLLLRFFFRFLSLSSSFLSSALRRLASCRSLPGRLSACHLHHLAASSCLSSPFFIDRCGHRRVIFAATTLLDAATPLRPRPASPAIFICATRFSTNASSTYRPPPGCTPLSVLRRLHQLLRSSYQRPLRAEAPRLNKRCAISLHPATSPKSPALLSCTQETLPCWLAFVNAPASAAHTFPRVASSADPVPYRTSSPLPSPSRRPCTIRAPSASRLTVSSFRSPLTSCPVLRRLSLSSRSPRRSLSGDPPFPRPTLSLPRFCLGYLLDSAFLLYVISNRSPLSLCRACERAFHRLGLALPATTTPPAARC